MGFESWILFVLTETVLCMSPGPAVLLVLSVGLTHGRRFGVLASSGILIANLFYFLLSATSLGAVLLASWEVFFLIKWVGAAYLVWMGFRMCITGEHVHIVAAECSPESKNGMGTLWHGVVVQGANPKAILFFTALLPQFVDPSRPFGTQIAILAVTSIVIEFAVLAGYAVLAGQASHLPHRTRFKRVVNRIGGGLLIGAGAGLAALRRD
jgi:threonine/homoserine/homoserine lactone efflux protein